jgi:lactoylglutathione lyase
LNGALIKHFLTLSIEKTCTSLAAAVCNYIQTLLFKTMSQKKNAMLNHVALSVVNLQKSTQFYEDIIRLEVMDEPFKDGKHSWFRIGDHSQLHLIEASKEIRFHDKSTHLCFSVSSLEDFVARLEKAGIAYGNFIGNSKSPTIRPDGVKQYFLQDPDGYWLEINNDN